MNNFEIVASSTESTVVAEYTPEKEKVPTIRVKQNLKKIL